MKRVRLAASVVMMLAFAGAASAQEFQIPIEPFGRITQATIADVDVRRTGQISIAGATADKSDKLNHLAILSPSMTHIKLGFVSSATAGYGFVDGKKRGMNATASFGRVASQAAGGDFDYYNIRVKGGLPVHERLALAATVEQRRLTDRYDRTKAIGAADVVLANRADPNVAGATAFLLKGTVNCGYVRQAPQSGAAISDASTGLGIAASWPTRGGLGISIDYRLRNDIEGDAAGSLTFSHGIGNSSLMLNVDNSGTVSISFLTLISMRAPKP